MDFSEKKNVTFCVQACNDAFVLLKKSQTSNANTYEINIGAWSNSDSVIRAAVLKTYSVELVKCKTSDILNCTSAVPLWVSWLDGIIEFGMGHDIGLNHWA